MGPFGGKNSMGLTMFISSYTAQPVHEVGLGCVRCTATSLVVERRRWENSESCAMAYGADAKGKENGAEGQGVENPQRDDVLKLLEVSKHGQLQVVQLKQSCYQLRLCFENKALSIDIEC